MDEITRLNLQWATPAAYLEDLDYIVIETRGNCYDVFYYHYGDEWSDLTESQLEAFARMRGWQGPEESTP